MEDRVENLTPWLIDAIKPVVEEFIDRLEGDLSQADLTAATTAIQKALVAGVHHGVAVIAGPDSNLKVTWTGNDPDYDEWAERFGQSD